MEKKQLPIKMNIFIAKELDGTVIGLILAKSKDIALAFFNGKYSGVDSIEEINIDKMCNEFPSQPYFNLIETYTRKKYELRDYEDHRLINKRGG